MPDKPNKWLPSECFGCWNCGAECPSGALDFKFGSPTKAPTEGKLDISKRNVLTSAAAGLGALFMMRITPQAQARAFNPDLVRPPGALAEREFLKRCIQCGACMKVCPTNALHPTFLEAGLEGLWTPMLVPTLGYCEDECSRCGQVCPTGAIELLPLEEKKKFKIGLAAFDRDRCLPFAFERECLVCEEHCPIPTKAIYFTNEEISLRDGGTKVLKQPRVDPDLCNGCGVCANVCVFVDRPAVYITSANETRHPKNQPILPALSGGGFDQEPPSDDAYDDPY